MPEKLLSLAVTIIGFGIVAYFMITQLDMDVEMVDPALGLAFAFWFLFWFAWAFR